MRGRRASTDADAVVVLALGWLVSALHVAGTLLSGRPFGAEATLALVTLIGIPFAAWPRRATASRRVA